MCAAHFMEDCFLILGEDTTMPAVLTHSLVNLRNFLLAQVMIFTIEEINRNETLLPNVSIGYQIYDTCGSRLSTMSATMGLMNGLDFGSGDRCNEQPPLPAIIGETESSATVILSRTTGPFKIPVISPSATCECLSNRKDYPSFFRTIASDYHQSSALVNIVKYFGWSWVGAVNSDTDYGNNGMAVFLKIAQEEGICVEYSVKFYRTETEKLKKVVDTIKKGTAKMVEAMKNVHFTTKMGDHVWFDSSGGAVAQYEVVNWQQESDGSFQFKSVGYYDASLPPHQRLQLDTKNIIWAGGQLKLHTKAGNTLCRIMGDPQYPLLSKDGDLTIGGLFPVHSIETLPSFEFSQKPQLISCSSVYLRDFRLAQIMIFAIEEINRSENLLPNVSIGYRIYDSCGSRLSTMSATMGLMNSPEFGAGYRCNDKSLGIM
ncbi:hypothetical protein cypCar_00035550 [Cyprinus carpio]|nr:hypothetical protein cypCar_00035550 [Cyprinus carpio]